MRFTVATYNIHKGFSHLTRRVVIHELKERLHGLSADILFLQEVQGAHRRHARRYRNWPGKPQHEFIADAVWHEVAYGRNAVYRQGHHGNAVLSRFPILAQANLDISAHSFESRGLLHCVLRLGRGLPTLHCINVHLGLFERAGGLQTSTNVSGSQWDAPFGWANLQMMAVKGLRRYGYHEEADRIAVRFLSMVLKEFIAHNAILEKYDVVRRESQLGAGIKYGYGSNEIGFGWTNAAFVEMYAELPEDRKAAVLELY